MSPGSKEMDTEAIVVLVTFPDREGAEKLARALVEERLIACANLLSPIRSIYRWEGKVEEGEEILLVLKSSKPRFEALRARIVELHPYDCPEVLSLPVEKGHPPYLDWIAASV